MGEAGWRAGRGLRHLAVVAAVVALGSCAARPPATFDLSALAPGPRFAGAGGTLIVAEPSAVFALDSERVVIRTARGEVAYLAGAQWADRLPRLVQARIIQSFENRGRLTTVARPTDRVAGTRQLVADIRRFDVSEDSREAVVELALRLVNSETGRILLATIVSGRAPVSRIDGPGATAALDAALAQALQATLAFTARAR